MDHRETQQQRNQQRNTDRRRKSQDEPTNIERTKQGKIVNYFFCFFTNKQTKSKSNQIKNNISIVRLIKNIEKNKKKPTDLDVVKKITNDRQAFVGRITALWCVTNCTAIATASIRITTIRSTSMPSYTLLISLMRRNKTRSKRIFYPNASQLGKRLLFDRSTLVEFQISKRQH